MKNLGLINDIVIILLIVGGINTGLQGLFNISLLGIFGTFISRLIYIVIGAAAGYLIYTKYIQKSSESQ